VRKLIHCNTYNTKVGGEQLGGEQRYPPQVQASAESDQVICIRMSRVESSLSVLFWKVITCLGGVCIIDCESISDCMIKPFSALAYLFIIVVCSAVWYSLLRWSSTCWCEQMRGTPVDNRKMMVPLLSLGINFCFWAFL